MGQINLLHLTDYLPDYPGNFGNTLISITKSAIERGGSCFISFPQEREWHENIKKVGGKVIYLPVYKFKDKKLDVNAIKSLNCIIKKNQIELVHVHFGLSQKIITIFLKLFNFKLKVVWHWRGDVDDNVSRLKKLEYFIFYRFFADSIVYAHVANSNMIAKRLKHKKLVSSKKIISLHNSVDPKQFNPQNHSNEIDLLSLKYNTNNIFTLIMVRNFRRRVDFNIIIETMKYLKKKEVNIQLLWVGYGETETLIKSQVELEQLENIRFIGKVNNPVPYYYVSKINVIAWEPWCKETINNTAYEALACNVPVVGLNFGGLASTFSEAEGVFTTPLSPQKYAEKILYIKENYSVIQAKVAKGRNEVLNNYSLESYVNKLFKIYQGSAT